MLCDDLEGWDGRGERGGDSRRGNLCIHMADSQSCTEKLIQHCKVIILQ